MAPEKATAEQIQAFIDQSPSWAVVNDKLRREFVFANFVQAFGFMTETALVAERMNHHPEWFNVHKKVVVDLTTHKSDGITELDFSLAQKMDEIAMRK